MPDPDLLAQIAEALEGVTSGPWSWRHGPHEWSSRFLIGPTSGIPIAILHGGYDDTDCNFIAAARTLLPAASEEIARLRAHVEEVERSIPHECDGTCDECGCAPSRDFRLCHNCYEPGELTKACDENERLRQTAHASEKAKDKEIARLRAQVRIAREALEKVADSGMDEVSESGCTWCLALQCAGPLDAHAEFCPVGQALAALSAPTEAKEKSE